MKAISPACLILLLFIGFSTATTQNVSAQNARTFQNFFYEGSQVGSVYGDVGLTFFDYDGANIIQLGGQIGFPIGSSFELGAELNHITIDPRFGDNSSGLSDLMVIGRFLVATGETDISVGGTISLPVGDEDIGQGDVDLGVFGALRHYLNNRTALTGTLGIDFFDNGDDYDTSLHLGGGVVHQASPRLQLIGELGFLTDIDFSLLSFGVEYAGRTGVKFRPALGLGVDDGAPDLALLLRVLFN